MSLSFKNWQVLVEGRRVIDRDSHGTPWPTGEQETVVLIYVPDGTGYEVTVADDEHGRAQVTSLTIRPRPGEVVDHTMLRALPLRTLAEVAAGRLDVYTEARDEGLSRDVSEAIASAEPGEATRRAPRIDLHDFAAAWNATRPHAQTSDGRGPLPRREVLAEQFAIRLWRVDALAREARDAGLIEQARVGRPRKSQPGPTRRTPTTGKSADHTTTKKEQKP